MDRKPSDRPSILKLAPDARDERRELEFELEFQRSLTTAQRFELMFQRSRQMAEALLTHGHRAPSTILKRS